MKKNGFVEGAVISYIAIVITKLLGAFYNIPFYSIIGERGSIIYSFAYNIYVLFLDISTSGIPIAISIVLSEYAAKEMYYSKERAYTLGKRVVMTVSLLACAFLMIFAPQVASYYIGDMTDGVTVNEVAPAIRSIACCLVIVPFLSMRRGYLQGHKCVGVSSRSQVVEQLVRIVVVLVGAYITINILDLGVTNGVCVSLFGAFFGAGAAFIYLKSKERNSKELFYLDAPAEEKPDKDSVILKKLLTYCSVITIVAVASGVYNLVDMKLLLVGLERLDYSDENAQLIAGLASTWIPKICMIVMALAMGLTNSIAPHVAESYASGDMKKVNHNMNQAISTIFAIATPIACGMIIFAPQVFNIFYGENPFGANMLKFGLVLNVVASLVSVISMGMQSMNMGKIVCISTVVGICVNAVCDLPLIFLFDRLGLPAYLGATTSSILGECVVLAILLTVLKKRLGFNYSSSVRVLVKVLYTVAIMVVAVLALCCMMPLKDGGIIMYIQMVFYAVVGAAIFLVISIKNSLIADVIGEEILERITGKIKAIIKKIH